MFKGNSNNMAKTTNVNAPDRLNRIVEGTSIQGEINAESNLRIDGFVKGTVTTKGRLVIGVNGKIEGDIVCQNADIEGQIVGTIKVDELLTLKSTANINGRIATKKLAIEAGAEFTGHCDMGGKISPDQLKKEKQMTVEDILEEHA